MGIFNCSKSGLVQILNSQLGSGFQPLLVSIDQNPDATSLEHFQCVGILAFSGFQAPGFWRSTAIDYASFQVFRLCMLTLVDFFCKQGKTRKNNGKS